MEDRFMKNGVFSLEYDKETLRDMVLELQEENKKQKEFIDYMNKTMEECNNYSKYIEKKTKELHGRSYGKTY